MAQRSSGNGFLVVILVLLLAAVGIGYLMWSGGAMAPKPIEVDLALPKGPAMPDPVPMPDPQPVPAPVPKPG